MDLEVDWKDLVRQLAIAFKEEGQVAYQLDMEVPFEEAVVDLSPEPLEFEGERFSPKEVRGFLWENRKTRAMHRPNGVVWAVYDEEQDRTFVGIGASVEADVARRFAQLFPHRLTTEGI